MPVRARKDHRLAKVVTIRARAERRRFFFGRTAGGTRRRLARKMRRRGGWYGGCEGENQRAF